MAGWEDCCGPAGAEEDVEEGAILRTHRRRVLGKNDAPAGEDYKDMCCCDTRLAVPTQVRKNVQRKKNK